MEKYTKILLLLPFLGRAMYNGKTTETKTTEQEMNGTNVGAVAEAAAAVSSTTSARFLTTSIRPCYLESFPQDFINWCTENFHNCVFIQESTFRTLNPRVYYESYESDKNRIRTEIAAGIASGSYFAIPAVWFEEFSNLCENLGPVNLILNFEDNDTPCRPNKNNFTNVVVYGKNRKRIGGYTSEIFPTLRTIRFFSMDQVIGIGADFLYDCSLLKNIDLSPFCHVTEIGSNFLAKCTNLASIDLTSFSKVTSIYNGFLLGCSGLTEINLNPLSKVDYFPVSNGFLKDCSKLVKINISELPPYQIIAKTIHKFFDNNEKIQLISKSLRESIKAGEWISIKVIDLLGKKDFYNTIANDKGVILNFEEACDTSLLKNNQLSFRDVIIEGKNLTRICDLDNLVFPILETLNFENCPNITKIENNFLQKCPIININLSQLTNVTEIGDCFLFECFKLEGINLQSFCSVTKIGAHFLSSCFSLRQINLQSLVNVNSVGDFFLYNSFFQSSLRPSVDVSNFSIGHPIISALLKYLNRNRNGLSYVYLLNQIVNFEIELGRKSFELRDPKPVAPVASATSVRAPISVTLVPHPTPSLKDLIGGLYPKAQTPSLEVRAIPAAVAVAVSVPAAATAKPDEKAKPAAVAVAAPVPAIPAPAAVPVPAPKNAKKPDVFPTDEAQQKKHGRHHGRYGKRK